jgi:hypothetical protein
MNFFPWGHNRALIYTSSVHSEEDLIARTVEAAATIRQQPGIFEDTRQSLLSRQLCIKVGDRTFGQLLEIGTKYSFPSECQ